MPAPLGKRRDGLVWRVARPPRPCHLSSDSRGHPVSIPEACARAPPPRSRSPPPAHVGGLMCRRLYGPFRQMWTFPFEAFLLPLKHLCEASNWRTVPWTVACKWAMARAFTHATRGSTSALSIDVLPESDFLVGAALLASFAGSALMRAVRDAPDHAGMREARFLRFVSRDGVEMERGNWLLLACGDTQFIACVEEMVEVVLSSGPSIRLWCSRRTALEGVTEGSDGMLRVPKPPTDSSIWVRLERASVCQLECCDRGAHLEFRYVF
jgi:hypothetical protein